MSVFFSLSLSISDPSFICRFLPRGLHPELLTRIQLQSSPSVGPGTYDLTQYGDFSEKNVQKRREGPNWQQSLYTEQMAKIPHSSFKQTHEERKEVERRIGPGAYEVKDFLTEAEKRPQCVRGALDQLSPRFPKENLVGARFAKRTSVVIVPFSIRIKRLLPVSMAYPMRKSWRNVGNRVVLCLPSNGIKVPDHYR